MKSLYSMQFASSVLVLGAVVTASQTAEADHGASVFGGKSGGPITTIQATTAPQGTFIAGVTVQFVDFDRFSDGELAFLAGEHVHAHSADYKLIPSLNLAYGVTDDFTVSLVLPYVHRENLREAHHHHHEGGEVENEAELVGDPGGIGDLSLLGEYRFLNLQDLGLEAAVLFGLDVPTGGTHEKSREGERLETEHQPGSGSWDPFLGAAVTKRVGPVSLDANVLYTFATMGSQHTELGERFSCNVAMSYRFAGTQHEHEDGTMEWHSAWDFIVELNGLTEDQQRIDGEIEPDGGGTVVLLSPGLRYTSETKWSGFLSVGIPVISDPNAGEADIDFQILTGFSKAF